MIALGFDPGTSLGWALLSRLGPGAAWQWLAGGVLDGSDPATAVAALAALQAGDRTGLDRGPWVAGIETVAQVQGRNGPLLRAAQANELVHAARLGGRLEERLAASGWRVSTPSVDDVRAHFLGAAKPQKRGVKVDVDASCLAAAQHLVAGWPEWLAGSGPGYGARGRLLASHWPHVADAALCALYAGRDTA